MRPLGGGVEFGEDGRCAVRREFKEEPGIDVEVLGEPVVLENISIHEGAPGHEILFLFEVGFPFGSFDRVESVSFHESDGTRRIARWYRLEDLDLETGPRFFPDGLKAKLSARRRLSLDAP